MKTQKIQFTILFMVWSLFSFSQTVVENKKDDFFVNSSGIYREDMSNLPNISISATIKGFIETAAASGFIFQSMSVNGEGQYSVYRIFYTKTSPDPKYISEMKDALLKTLSEKIVTESDLSKKELDKKLIEKLNTLNDACWNAELKKDIKDLVLADLEKQLSEIKNQINQLVSKTK